MSTEVITIDGSYGEGGGQILRTGLSLSAITGRPVEFVNIRANRSGPGLKPQHLASVNAAAQICAAGLNGAAVGSQRLSFAPQSPAAPGNYRFDIGTAGAAPLVLQTVLLPLALSSAASEVTVSGGTHVPHAPTAQYLERVYLETLRCHGLECTAVMSTAGFFPRGGGTISASIRPSKLLPLDLTGARPKLSRLSAILVASNLPEHVCERGAEAAKRILRERNIKTVDIEILTPDSPGPGASVVLVADCDGRAFAGFSAIGERGKPMEKVVQEACDEFRRWWKSDAICDEHLADQLVLPMALAAGESRWTTARITDHLRTVIWVAQHFLPIEASVEKRDDGSGIVTLRGAGR